MTDNRKAWIFLRILLCTALCLFVLPFAMRIDVYADDTLIISDFADSDTEWKAGDNVTGVGPYTFSWEQDGRSYSRSCLKIDSGDIAAGLIRGAIAHFPEPLDLSEYRKIAFDIYVPVIAEDPDSVFLTRLTLMSVDGDSIEHLEMIESGEWNHVEADIGAWGGRNEIVMAEIVITVDTVISDYPAGSFFVDDVCALQPVDRDMTARFLFDTYAIGGGSAKLAGDKSMITIFSDGESEMSLEAAIFMPQISYDVNCLRIRLSNRTDSDTLTLHYSTSDSQVTTEDKSVTVPIVPNSEARDYYAYVGDAAQLQSLRLMFGSSEGRVEIVSISAISAYEMYEYETCGVLTSCSVSDDLSSVRFLGEIGSEAALASRNGHIAIYAFTDDTLPSAQQLAGMTPLVKSTMTTRFELSWHISGDGAAAAGTRFLAVVVHENGTYSLIAPPFYINNPEKLAKKSYPMVTDGKGFAANDISLVGDSDAGLTLIELDVKKVFVGKSEAEPYIYAGETYYFNPHYLNVISSKLEVLKHADVQVLLRIVNWNHKYGETLTAVYAADSYVNYSKATAKTDGVDYVGALGAYAAQKWAADGKIVGVVFGMGENIIGNGESLNTTVNRTSGYLRSIYTSLKRVNSVAKVYISLTDLYTLDVQTGREELGLAEYLPALIAETARCGQFSWELAVERFYRAGSTNGSITVSINDCGRLRALLAEYNCSDKNMIFIDNTYSAPDSRLGSSVQSFVVGCYTALFAPDIDAYIANTASGGADIAESVRYADSDQSSVVITMAKTMLKVDDLAQVIENYNESKLPARRLSKYAASTAVPSGMKGSFTYYRFDSVSSIGGIVPLYYSRDLHISVDGESVLETVLDSSIWESGGNAAWMGIAHTFDVAENLRLTPTLAITLKLENVMPNSLASVPVKLVLFGENERFEASADVPVDEWTTLYISTGEFLAAKDTEGFQLLIGDSKVASATMKLRRIDGMSREYDDESLAKVIADSRLKKGSGDQSDGSGAYIWIYGGALIAAATVLAVALLSRRKGGKRE